MVATVSAKEEILKNIWCEVLSLDVGFDSKASFFELGGDSLKAVHLYDCLEARFGHEIAPEDFFGEPTFDNLVALMAA